MTKSAKIEIRNVDNGLDEVCADKASVHLEQMSATAWWLGVTVGTETVHVWLHSKAMIKARAERQ